MSAKRSLVLFFPLGFLVACATSPPTIESVPEGPHGEKNYTSVPVYYATDRDFTLGAVAAKTYGPHRSAMAYGTCWVSIPSDHQPGELESPSLWRLEFNPDPQKHVVLMRVLPEDKDKFFEALSQSSTGNNALIYIHGFNVTFEDAARRAAQMTYDLRWAGPSVFFSWPSQGTIVPNPFVDYIEDEASAEWAQADLEAFLDDFISKSGAKKVFVIAHSMGTHLLTNALVDLTRDKPDEAKRINAVVLAAPDIDRQVFKTQIAPVLTQNSTSLTLYASSNDDVLKVSKQWNGYRRLGDATGGVFIMDKMDTIDATDIDDDFLGHSYYGDSRSMLTDLYYLFSGVPVDKRFSLEKVAEPDGTYYWRFRSQAMLDQQ